MPSIPQSLLWISLVVLWLFVLVPMLINKRDTVRRTSDVALATRVLNGGVRARLRRRSGPAAGHRHDPLWSGDGSDLDDYNDHETEDYEEAVREAVQEARVRSHTRTVTVVATVTESTTSSADEANTAPVYLDVDVVEEDSGALPVGGAVQEGLFDSPAEEVPVVAFVPESAPVADDADVDMPSEIEQEQVVEEPAADDEYEYVDDTSGLDAADDADDAQSVVTPHSSRRRRMESSATAAAVSARKYRFRKRVLTALAAVMVLTAVLSFTVSSGLWWACGTTATVTILYLAYLRRQTRIEEQVRRRRLRRMARSGASGEAGEGGDSLAERRGGRNADDVGARLRRPGAVVLDIDDEDPVFEHLDEVRFSRRYDLPRAAGQ
ncbi:MAG TPA: hypothetical protein PLK19_13010 [Mycobacterium sp.]|nr:hypothetical protein [Mycobacterium sp.]